MILVDPGVWIDFLDGGNNPEVLELVRLIEDGAEIAITGLILQELVQGCSTERQVEGLVSFLSPFKQLSPELHTYLLAGKLFRDCRRKGFTIRSSVDCLIAACSIGHDCALLQNDRDYRNIATVSPLRLHPY